MYSISYSKIIRIKRVLFKQIFKRPSFLYNYATDSNIIKSQIEDIKIPNLSISQYLWRNLSKWSQKTAIVCLETNRQYTYEQLYKNSLSLTKFLKDSLQLQQQNTVAIILPNLPEFPLILIGAIQAGLRVTTINPSYTSEEIAQQLKSSESRLIFCLNDLLPVIRGAFNILKKDIPIISVKQQFQNFDCSNTIDLNETITGNTCEPIEVNADDTALLLYSSGTTGLPKGVQLTHRNVVANLSQNSTKEMCPLYETTTTHQDTIPGFLPFFHCYGLIVIILASLAQGAKIVTMLKFTSDNFIKLTKYFKPNVIYGIPATVQMITNNTKIKTEDLNGLRTIISGAAPLGVSDIERFHQKTGSKIDILQLYGMTEVSPLATVQSKLLENGIKIGGSGVLLPNTEARIIPIDGKSIGNLPPDHQGEILLRGPQVMKDYYNNHEANQQTFLPDNWLRTGDIGYYDRDGHFFITDRLKELIKVKGFQVAPAELEALLRAHPNVEDAGVVGIPHPRFGQVPKAFIIPKRNVSINQNDLIEFVAKKTVEYKRLRGGIALIDAIPKTASGKILRRQLRDMQ